MLDRRRDEMDRDQPDRGGATDRKAAREQPEIALRRAFAEGGDRQPEGVPLSRRYR